ncbi:hypothetical protein ABN115_17075 [Providencia rettgeri]|uniref:Uncharacterized protein n=1 Tax=Providencia hangzhouensis TaxID=3031799 RepID=A0ABY9ZD02_9GAMM|nr:MULTISPECIES: hypothetical protein [Providencia]QLI96841.1 hypothetical protein H0A34_07335 [Providencia rettgeri]WNK25602.1 hypothetical protein PZ638_06910 [Providencia hangzhouensis]
MPALTSLQKAAFDAIDTLHFNQILMSFVYEEPIEEWYHYILNRINGEIQKKGITGKQAEIAKHYILANLEIHLSVDNKYLLYVAENVKNNNIDDESYSKETAKKVVEHGINFSLAYLSFIADKNGIDREFVSQVVDDLINDDKVSLSTMPFFIKYRLTECCYAFEYPDAPIGFYHELVSHDIIPCGKYSPNIDKNVKESGLELSLLFIRAGLLFEFRMLQSAIRTMISVDLKNEIFFTKHDSDVYHINRRMIADYYKRPINFQCNEYVSEIDAEKLLKNMSKFYVHKRMFSGTQGSWLGTLGAFDIEASRWNEPNKAIYDEADNNLTISEKVKSKLLDYGFSVSARSLYLRHKAIRQDNYSKIQRYYYFLIKQEFGPPWNNNYYYNLALEYKKKDLSE